MSGRSWTQEELDFLEDYSDSMSTRVIASRLGRSENSVRLKACRMGIILFKNSTDRLSRHAVAQMLDVDDRTVMIWQHKYGLRFRKIGNLLVCTQEALIKFLKNHQELWSAARGDTYLLQSEPWFADKKQKDLRRAAEKPNEKQDWTDIEVKQLVLRRYLGKSFGELAAEFGRTEKSCKCKYHDYMKRSVGRLKKWEEYESMDEAIDDYIRYMDTFGQKLTKTEARKAISKKIPLESSYQDKIIKYLRGLPECIKAWKESKGKYGSRNGTPDIIAIMKPGGVYYGFEVKRPLLGEPSELQQQFINDVTAAGGHAYLVVSVNDVKEILKKEGVIK